MKPVSILNKLNESTWCGVPGTKHVWHGEWSDPEVEYKGKLYNEWDLQEYIGEAFNDYCKENNIEVKDWSVEFAKWLEKNPDYAYSAFNDLEPVEEKELDESDILVEKPVYMNTWKNYNMYGADLEAYGIKDGWMTIDEALAFCEKYAEDEPFINDTDGVPIEISDYDNPVQKLEQLKRIEDADVDPNVLKAFLECGSYTDIDEIIEKIESGDYIFFEGVDNDEDLAHAYIDMVGGITEAVGDRVDQFFDEEDWKDDNEADIRDMIASDNGIDIDDVDDDDVALYLDSMLDDVLDSNKQAHNDDFFERYFDYDYFGSELSYDYTYTSTGALSIL